MLGQLVQHCTRDGVEPLGRVQCDRRDMVADLVQDLRHGADGTRLPRSVAMQNPLTFLGSTELNNLVPMHDAIDALRHCFAARPTHLDRVHMHAGTSEVLVMPASTSTVAGIKMVGIQLANAQRGLPVIQGAYLLFDGATGTPVAMFDGAALTTLRTPAVSALATNALARPDVTSHGIIGTGPQAAAHAVAIAAVRPAIATVIVAGRNADRAQNVVDHLLKTGFNASIGTYRQAAACDVVSLATRSAVPLIAAADVRPGTHLNLVGAYRLDMREVAGDLVAASVVVVDDLSAARAEAGDLHLAVTDGSWSWQRVAGDLADVATGTVHRNDATEITMFKSVGLAIQDLAIAERAAMLAGLLSAHIPNDVDQDQQ